MPAAQADLYAVLGVAPGVDQTGIHTAYRRMCRRYHPDVCREEDAGSRMRQINAAYQILRDPGRRLAYDRGRSNSWAPPDAWEAARRAWRPSARPPSAGRSARSRLRLSVPAIDVGFLRRGETASRRVVVSSSDGAPIRAQVLTRGDWLRVDLAEIKGTDVLLTVTADPRELHAFWSAEGQESARVDGWVELVEATGSVRLPVAAILRREATGAWWNPFARRVS